MNRYINFTIAGIAISIATFYMYDWMTAYMAFLPSLLIAMLGYMFSSFESEEKVFSPTFCGAMIIAHITIATLDIVESFTIDIVLSIILSAFAGVVGKIIQLKYWDEI